LRFSEEYKRQHGGEPFDNDWYEFIEYGTTNTLSIFFQRNGISRETADYIKNHREYIVDINGEIRLKSTLATCGSVSVENEVKDLILNISSLFIDG
jgi:hypothetical protein